MTENELMILRGQFLTEKVKAENLTNAQTSMIVSHAKQTMDWFNVSQNLKQMQSLKASLEKFLLHLDERMTVQAEIERLEPLLGFEHE